MSAPIRDGSVRCICPYWTDPVRFEPQVDCPAHGRSARYLRPDTPGVAPSPDAPVPAGDEPHRRSEEQDYDPTPCCVVCWEPWPCAGSKAVPAGDEPFAGVTFPDADTERAVRLGASWSGSYETDVVRFPADKMLDVDVLAAAMNDAQIKPEEIALGHDLRVPAGRILDCLMKGRA